MNRKTEEEIARLLVAQRESSNKCINCLYYCIDWEECRYNAPVFYGMANTSNDKGVREVGHCTATWPNIINCFEDWCGKFEPNTPQTKP